jgi:hypothetical protein
MNENGIEVEMKVEVEYRVWNCNWTCENWNSWS